MTPRFRVWDNRTGEYRSSSMFCMDSQGNIRWHTDGEPLNGSYFSHDGRYEVEFGNSICFHNDIVQAKMYGGHWMIEHAGKPYFDNVPREHVNMTVYKECGYPRSVHELYWDVPIIGVALMDPQTMEFVIHGLTCKDKFYGYEGEQFSWSDVSVIGSSRTHDHTFCHKCGEDYARTVKNFKEKSLN